MRRPTSHRGYVTNGPGVEADVLSCSHCQMQFEVVPPKGAASHSVDMCGHCSRPLCPRCAGVLAGPDGKCVPFMDKLAEYENRHALRRSLGID